MAWYHIHDGPASPPMKTAFGIEWGQSNAGNICTGVMPSPPRIAGASKKYIRHRLIEDKNKIETIVVFKLLNFGLGFKIREINGEHGWGCESVRLVRVTCKYVLVRSTPHSPSYLPVCALELQSSMRLAFWESPSPSNSPYICTSYLRHLFYPTGH